MHENAEIAGNGANDNDDYAAPPRVITYEEMTDAQKRIVDAGNAPGIPVPAHLSGAKLTAYFLRRAFGTQWSEMSEEERETLRFLEAADDETYQRWCAEQTAKHATRGQSTAQPNEDSP